MRSGARAFVTGGCGLVGAALVRRLLRAGWDVAALDRDTQTPVLRDLRGSSLRLIQGDITDRALLHDVFATERPDTVVHLAAVLGADCRNEPRLCAEVNCMATLSVLEESERVGVRRVVLASSEAVYGPDRFDWRDGRPTPQRPDYPFDGTKLYAMSKLFVEGLAEQFAERGLSTCGLRLAMVIGPGQRRSAASATVSASQVALTVVSMVESAALGQPLTVTLCPEDEIMYLYVDDAAAQFEAMCHAPEAAFAERRFFHTGGDLVTLGRVVDEIRSVQPDAPLDVRALTPHAFPGSRRPVSDAALRRAVGVSRMFPLRAGIAAHVAAVRQPMTRSSAAQPAPRELPTSPEP
jgi:UDP-glucose 4-epimerase